MSSLFVSTISHRKIGDSRMSDKRKIGPVENFFFEGTAQHRRQLAYQKVCFVRLVEGDARIGSGEPGSHGGRARWRAGLQGTRESRVAAFHDTAENMFNYH